MFAKCTSLTQAPELPATTLANSCYSDMFVRCSSLTQAPVLPATTLADNCYSNMFYICSSLTQAPQILPAETLADSCYKVCSPTAHPWNKLLNFQLRHWLIAATLVCSPTAQSSTTSRSDSRIGQEQRHSAGFLRPPEHSNAHRLLLIIRQHVAAIQFQQVGLWSLSEKIINTHITLN